MTDISVVEVELSPPGFIEVELEVPAPVALVEVLLQGPQGRPGLDGVDFIMDDRYGIVGDADDDGNGTDDSEAIQALADYIRDHFGRGTMRATPDRRYNLGDGDFGLLLPDRVGLIGNNPSGANVNEPGGSQLFYHGDGVLLGFQAGELNLRQSQGCWVERIGLSIHGEGATGLRLWRTRGTGLHYVIVRMNADNQRSFHLKGEGIFDIPNPNYVPGDGSYPFILNGYEGVYDADLHLCQSLNTHSYANAVHFDITGGYADGYNSPRHGQVNTTHLTKPRTAGSGTGYRIGPCLALQIDSPDCEGFDRLAFDFVGAASGVRVSSPYMEASQARVDPDDENSPRIWDPAAGAKAVTFLNELGHLSRKVVFDNPVFGGGATILTNDIAEDCVFIRGNERWLPVIGIAYQDELHVMGEAINHPRLAFRSSGRIGAGDGTMLPPDVIIPGGPTTKTTYYTQHTNLTHNLALGQVTFWTIDGPFINGVINNPTGIIGSPRRAVVIKNAHSANVTFHFSSLHRMSSAFTPNYTLAPGHYLVVEMVFVELISGTGEGKWFEISHNEVS